MRKRLYQTNIHLSKQVGSGIPNFSLIQPAVSNKISFCYFIEHHWWTKYALNQNAINKLGCSHWHKHACQFSAQSVQQFLIKSVFAVFGECPLVAVICTKSNCHEQIRMSLLAGTFTPNFSLIPRAVSEKVFKDFAAIFKNAPWCPKYEPNKMV